MTDTVARTVSPDGTSWSMVDHDELFGLFNRFYGTLWSEGTLDQATKEVGRLRNARINDCGL